MGDESRKSQPRIVNIDCSKLSKIAKLESTKEVITSFKKFIDNKV